MGDIYQDKIFEIEFHQIVYLLHLVATPSNLTIDLESKSTGDIWIGEFTAQKLEENTQKTGNFKKYPVFVQMLLAAINSSNDSVELDLLTYQDLQQLKNKRSNQATNKSFTNQTNQNQNKRYLMLNYVAEFDKVHYPLQLLYQQIPTVDRQRLTVKRLRSQLDIYRKGSSLSQQMVSQNMNLKQQNQMYKLRIKKLEESQMKSINTPVQVQQKCIIKQVKDPNTEKQYNQLKLLLSNTQSQLNIIKSKLQYKQIQVQQLKQQLYALNDQLSNSDSKDKQIKKIQQKLCKEFNDQLKSVSKETEELVYQLKKVKDQNKKQKTKITELEKELSMMVKRNLSKEKITGGINTSAYITNTKRSSNSKNSKVNTPRSRQQSITKTKLQNYLKNSKSKQKARQISSSRRISVMDSDTQSSKNRRMGNRNASPYRNSQALKRTPSNKSLKGASPKSNRSRSQSKKLTQNSLNNSQIFTESQNNFQSQHNFASDSDDQSGKVNSTLQMLIKRRQQQIKKPSNGNSNNNRTINNNNKSKQSQGVQKQIMNIAQMLKKSRKQLMD